jgi:hypothetical protein
MPKVNPQEGAAKWAKRTKNATQEVKDGVNRVSESPMAKAAQALDKALQNYMRAIESGKMEAGLNRVTLQQWKDAMVNIGIGRIAAGVDNKGTGKMQQFAQEFYPFLERVQGEIDAMPSTTLEDNIQRMVHNARRLAEFRRS